MNYVADASEIKVHYAVTDAGLTIYIDASPAMKADKPGQLIEVARDCVSGGLMVPVEGDAVQICDHAWLLRLGAECLSQAAAMIAEAKR